MLSALVAAFCVTSSIGETLFASGWDAVRSSTLQQARETLIVAARIDPLRHDMRSGPGYLALRFMAEIPPDIAIADMRRALVFDPYAPDLLNALVFVEMYQKDFAAADADLATLQRAEPGFMPDYLTQR